jgi:hypothetical protein
MKFAYWLEEENAVLIWNSRLSIVRVTIEVVVTVDNTSTVVQYEGRTETSFVQTDDGWVMILC